MLYRARNDPLPKECCETSGHDDESFDARLNRSRHRSVELCRIAHLERQDLNTETACCSLYLDKIVVDVRRVPEHTQKGSMGRDFTKQLHALSGEFLEQEGDSGQITAWPR